MFKKGEGGQVPELPKELHERTLGKPVEADFMERLDELEKHFTQGQRR